MNNEKNVNCFYVSIGLPTGVPIYVFMFLSDKPSQPQTLWIQVVQEMLTV